MSAAFGRGGRGGGGGRRSQRSRQRHARARRSERPGTRPGAASGSAMAGEPVGSGRGRRARPGRRAWFRDGEPVSASTRADLPAEEGAMALSWLEWSDDLLERAHRERRPLLLHLVCDWGPCDAGAGHDPWSDEALCDLVEQSCLPVRVDKDRLPELDRRYQRGGWPTTVLIDGFGVQLEGGVGLSAARIARLVQRAVARCQGQSAASLPPELPAEPLPFDAGIPAAIERSLMADFDERYGGFGDGPKFPHTEALDYALLRHAEARNPRLHEILEKTFTRMAQGALQDHVDGGFFRYCARRDWSQPHTEKLLETNAGLARNVLECGQLMGRADLLAVGERTVEALLRDLLDEDVGLFHSGLEPDDEYYALDAAARRTRRPPARSQRMLADGNARAVSALLKAGAVLARLDLTQRAVAVAESLLRRLWRRGRGMLHVLDETGAAQHASTLRDQAEMARALLHLLQYTDDRRFAAPLEDLVEHITARYVDTGGAFTSLADGRRSAGRLDAQIVDAAVAGEVLLRASLLLGRPGLRDVAVRALQVHADDFRRYGYAMAAYGRSVELVLHPPLHIVVVGQRQDALSLALLRAASATYLPSRVVQRLDGLADAPVLQRLCLPVRSRPVAFVMRQGVCLDEVADAGELPEALQRANARRLQA